MSTACFLTALFLFCQQATLRPVSTGAPARPLTVLPAGGARQSGPGKASADIGAIDSIQNPHPTRLFAIRNDTEQPVHLTEVKGSCGCETISLLRGQKSCSTLTLLPGEGASIRVTLDSRRLSGAVRLSVWVYAEGQEKPAAEIEMTGSALELVRFAPAFLYFGTNARGVSRALPLTVTVDSAIAPNGIPPISSSNPDVKVAPEGPSRRGVRNGRSVIEQKYRASLSHASPCGPINGVLGLHLGTVAASVPLSGNVTGSIAVSPSVVLFGSVAPGRSSSREVILTAASQRALQDIGISSSSPYVAGALTAVEAAESHAGPNPRAKVFHRRLTLTLKEGAPAGPLQAQIRVASASRTGDSVSLTAVAEIQSR